MVDYASEIWSNVPAARGKIALSQEEDGQVGTIPEFIGLRRWGVVYRPLEFQQDIIEGVSARLQEGAITGLIALPTGSGKTRTATWLCLREMAKTAEPDDAMIWMAPQKELVNQAAEAIQAAWWSGQGPDSLDIRIVRRSRDLDIGPRPTCLCLTPSMAKAVMRTIGNRRVRVAVFDEAHHAAAAVFSKIWLSLRRTTKPSLAIGLSATPSRRNPSEDPLLREAFDGVIFCSKSLGTQPVRSLIKRGVLSEPYFRLIPGVPRYARYRGPEDPRALRELIVDPDRWQAIIRCVSETEKGQTVIYALNREHGRAITHHLRSIGVEAEYLDGETPTKLRVGILERFRYRHTRVLVNVALLVEGVDCPAAEAAVLTYPVRHTTRLQQMVGRVLRGPAVGGTDRCRIWALEGSQQELDDSLFATRYQYRGWRVETLSRRDPKS
jgi:superfamily II DNA or RNA helicase